VQLKKEKFTMRRGRTVQIKTSSATAWRGSMTTLPFVSQPANRSTLSMVGVERSTSETSRRTSNGGKLGAGVDPQAAKF